jgi:hypothetical protein
MHASTSPATRRGAFASAGAAVLALAWLPGAGAAGAGPCEAPGDYVRTAPSGVTPLQRPWVIGGIAAVALREQGGERWVELAASSEDDVRLRLAGQSAAGPGTVVATWGERVWLRCPAVVPDRRG